ncbi:MAG: hypothetical protein AAF614_06460 [Chloroflexota bacterium]
MTTTQLILELIVYGLALWLGMYLIARDISSTRLWLAGLGLVTYALGLVLDMLSHYAPQHDLALLFVQWQRFFVFLPALFWIGLLVYLIPGEVALRQRLAQHPRPMAILLVASIFFVLGVTFLRFPLPFLPRTLVLLGIGGDLLALGGVIAFMDAFDQGEALLSHFIRSLDYAFFTVLIFAGQVILVMALSIGVNFPLLLLLIGTIAAAIFVQTFSTQLQSLMDRIIYFNAPSLRQEQENLRLQADALVRTDNSIQPDDFDQAEFVRHTRQALSQMGNLPKLASSPLARLALVERRLQAANKPSDTLTRAAELRLLLSESIERLRPPAQETMGVTDEWRYYNALYYPYVRGLKPYSRRLILAEEETAVRPILDWFRTQVPQRTLYNWQNAAAKLIARDLRERSLRRVQ